MLVSIVFITNRPGVYDILFGGLATQTNKNYELIVIDDLQEYRKEKVIEYAGRKNINLTYYGHSKPKTYPETKYCYANAMNTGAIHANGDILLFIQDMMWMPPNIIENIIELYRVKNDLLLLSFQEILYDAPKPQKFDKSSIYLYDEEMTKPINEMGFPIWQDRNPDVFPDNSILSMAKVDFWECYCASINTSLFRYLNGFNEVMDRGNDCNEKDIMIRCKMLGISTYLINIPVWQINHHLWKEDQYLRDKSHSNLNIFQSYIDKMRSGEVSFIPPNNMRLFTRHIGSHSSRICGNCDILSTPDIKIEYDEILLSSIISDVKKSTSYLELNAICGEYAINMMKNIPELRSYLLCFDPRFEELINKSLALNGIIGDVKLVSTERGLYVNKYINSSEFSDIKNHIFSPILYSEYIDSIEEDIKIIKINNGTADILKNISSLLKKGVIIYIQLDSEFVDIFKFLSTYGYSTIKYFANSNCARVSNVPHQE